MNNNIYAAIAMALYEYAGNNVHDVESGTITIKPKQTMFVSLSLRLLTQTEQNFISVGITLWEQLK